MYNDAYVDADTNVADTDDAADTDDDTDFDVVVIVAVPIPHYYTIITDESVMMMLVISR